MGSYSRFIGRRVGALYRAGDFHLLACGILVSETAKAVFVEERFSRNGKEKIIRIEIPHEYLLRLRECPAEDDIHAAAGKAPSPK